MRKKVAIGFSFFIHLLIILGVGFSKMPVTPFQPQRRVNLILEEETAEPDKKKEEIIPFNKFDSLNYKKKRSPGVPDVPAEEVNMDLTHFRELPLESHIDISVNPEEVIFTGPAVDGVFVPLPGDILFSMDETGILPEGQVAGYSGEEIEWSSEKREPERIVEPEFPEIVTKTGMEVDVVVRIDVDSSGKVVDSEVVNSSGYAAVDVSVKNTLNSWIFKESETDRIVSGLVTVRFRLTRKSDGEFE